MGNDKIKHYDREWKVLSDLTVYLTKIPETTFEDGMTTVKDIVDGFFEQRKSSDGNIFQHQTKE